MRVENEIVQAAAEAIWNYDCIRQGSLAATGQFKMLPQDIQLGYCRSAEAAIVAIPEPKTMTPEAAAAALAEVVRGLS